ATAAVEEHADGITSHRRARIAKRAAKLLEVTTAPEKFTETCKNSRLRLSRRDTWWDADNLTDYWKARMRWHSALSIAQDRSIADANSYPKISGYGEGWSAVVDSWRNALVQQMLTPAPDMGAINWKRAQLRSGEHRFTKVEPGRLQQAIDADVEWLKDHPARRSNSEAMARTREFKEVMRQRIREIAASRGLSDEEIKPVWNLKHQRVAEFSEKYGVNLKWLIGGEGDIFKTGPKLIAVGKPATVAATMPEADQQELRATVREILQEREQ
ncbi:hypothetical protein, partial [Bradyrhizobium sp.]|uniref:hypothetical protein n=1 Tax=Bradyrhizobium sp. TaxID=376 RepID=UPI0025B86BBF